MRALLVGDCLVAMLTAGCMWGNVSLTLDSNKGRKRDCPSRNVDNNSTKLLRYSRALISNACCSMGTHAITSVRVQAMSNNFSICRS